MQTDTDPTPTQNTNDTNDDTGTGDKPETGANGEKAEKAKRERDTWPYRIVEVASDGETMKLVPGVQFDERRKAEAWIRRQGAEGKFYVPATMPEDALEVVPKSFRSVPLKGARKATEG